MKKRFLALLVLVIAVAIVLWANNLVGNNGRDSSIAHPATLRAAAPNGNFTLPDGNPVSLSQYKGKAVLLWFVSTWCSSCAQGTSALGSNIGFFKRNNVTIIEVETYKNLGYPGPSISSFVDTYAPHAYANDSITIGYSSYSMMQVYDGKASPDIYYLIAKNGTIVDISSSPGETMGSLIYAIERL